MKPAEYLVLLRPATAQAGTPSPRAYAAVGRGANVEAFLTLHSKAGTVQAVPYGSLQFIDGDDRGGTQLRLLLPRMKVTLHGRQLGPVFEAIRTRTAAHVHEFDGARHDPPEPGEPVITELTIALDQAKAQAAA